MARASLADRMGDPLVTKGRRRPVRSPGERDSDRILSCTAFQRLAGVTQVVPAGTGNAAHSRLTHSLKVGRVARRLAQRVLVQRPELADRVDLDAVEAAGLAHDLGHPPFGHVAERRLDELMEEFGGFEGNAQSFRIVTRLAHRFPEVDGLDLSRATLDTMLKYPWFRVRSDQRKAQAKRWRKWGAYQEDEEAFVFARGLHRKSDEEPCLGAAIMDWADDLTYAVHDLEDFFRAGAVPLDRLCTNTEERDAFAQSVDREAQPGGRLEGKDPAAIKEAAAGLFGRFLDFVSPYSGIRLDRQLLRERTDYLVGRYMAALDVNTKGNVTIKPKRRNEVEALKQLTWHYVIDRPGLSSVQRGQQRVIEELFSVYTSAAKGQHSVHLLPPLEQELIEAGVSAPRVAADFIARLTEDRALELHRRITGRAAWTLPAAEH